MPAAVVTGTQWGDEGKGKIVDLLAADADVGIGPAYEDKMARTGIRVGDLFDEGGFRDALERNLREKNAYLQALLGEPALSFDDIHERYRGYRERLRPFAADTTAELRAAFAA